MKGKTSRKMRLDKALALAGYGTRRQVKELIKEGLVSVNGEIVKRVIDVTPDDFIEVDGEVFHPRHNIYVVLNKPAGYSSNAKEYNSCYQLLDVPYASRLKVAGRLDVDVEGLLLLSTDNEFIHRITHPRWKVEKEYWVVLDKPLDERAVRRIERGVYIGGGERARPAKVFEEDGFVRIVVTEGKYHLVKRIFLAVERRVLKMKRVRIGSFRLTDLELGEWRELTDDEITILKSDVGLS